MGYKPRRTLYKLDFSETEHAGLEVTTTSVTLGALLEFTEMSDAAESGVDQAAVRRLFGEFARVLVDWNVEDDAGAPVPQTLEGLLSLEFGFVMAVINAWIGALSKAPPPLPAGSASGGTSPEASLGLGSLSQSLPSS